MTKKEDNWVKEEYYESLEPNDKETNDELDEYLKKNKDLLEKLKLERSTETDMSKLSKGTQIKIALWDKHNELKLNGTLKIEVNDENTYYLDDEKISKKKAFKIIREYWNEFSQSIKEILVKSL